MNKHDLFIYLLGAIDSRGFFCLNRLVAKTRHGKKRIVWVHLFSFQTVKELTCTQLKDMFGGTIQQEKRGKNHLQLFAWKIFGDELRDFCSRIHLNLFILKEECTLMMEFRRTYNIVNRGHRLPIELVNERDSLTKKFKDMHRKIGHK